MGGVLVGAIVSSIGGMYVGIGVVGRDDAAVEVGVVLVGVVLPLPPRSSSIGLLHRELLQHLFICTKKLMIKHQNFMVSNAYYALPLSSIPMLERKTKDY